MSDFDFESVGGVRQIQGTDEVWNFGLADAAEDAQLETPPFFYDAFPKLQGKWDGKTTVNQHNAVRQILGRDLKPHRQRAGTCFPAGTPVLMADGTEKPIEAVQVGDEVISHTGAARRVLRTMERSYTGEMVRLGVEGLSSTLWTTAEHPIFAPNVVPGGDWLEASQVCPGDSILHLPARQVLTVKFAQRNSVSDYLVYNLEADSEHSYVAGGIAVHNCGGQAGSRGYEVLQPVLMATGKRANFKLVSHAWLYYLARRDGRMLGGGDGVPGGSIVEVLARYGAVTREEAGDPHEDGPNVDTLAVQWGAGRIDRETQTRLFELARDNVVTARVRVRSAQELADAIASGGVCICSDMQGFTMERDRDGFCRPQGQWAHYHVRSSVNVTPRGRKGFGYDQSWGKNVPAGPLLPGHPDNCFGVDWDVQDQIIRSRWAAYDVIFAFNLWDLQDDTLPDMPWVF